VKQKTAAPAAKAPAKSVTAKKLPAKAASAEKSAEKKAPAKAASGDTAPEKKAPAKAASGDTAPEKKAPAKKALVAAGSSEIRSGEGMDSVASGPASSPALAASTHARPQDSGPSLVAPEVHGIDDQKFLEEVRGLLMEERATYTGQIEDLAAEVEAMAEEMEPGDIQFDEESGEGDTLSVDRERDLTLSAQAVATIEEIDAALQRMKDGTYGICEKCHQLIPRARLRALPYARLCVSCKSGGLFGT